MNADLSSGDLARATGNTVRAIRFYEAEGLLEPADVSEGGHRRYREEHLERLQLITDLRELGLSLGEIRAVFDLRSGCRTAAEFALRLEQVLVAQLEQAQKRLERLRRVKREMLEALSAIHVRLSSAGTQQCACAVGEDGAAPRFVKVLAKQKGCCGEPAGRGGAPGGKSP